MKKLPNSLDEIIFETRNKEYGAYKMRQNYSTNVLRAVFIGTLLFLSVISIPLIAGYLNEDNRDRDIVWVSDSLLIIDKKLPDEKIPEAPKKQVYVPPFTVPIIVIDTNEVTSDLSDLIDRTRNHSPFDTSKIYVDDGGDPNPPIIADPVLPEFIIVEEMPEFPGGDEARIRFLAENINYPITAKQIGIQGPVFVTFVINERGKVVDVKLLRGIGGGCDEEALRVVKKMPDWSPGKQAGKEVRVRFNMSINFRLE